MTLRVLPPDEIIPTTRIIFGISDDVASTCSPSPGVNNLGFLTNLAMGSATARRILEQLNSNPRHVSVCFVQGGGDDVKSIYDPDHLTCVIRTDLKYRLTEYPGVVLMDRRILTFHELGHAVQHVVLRSEDGGPLSESLTRASIQLKEFTGTVSYTVVHPRTGVESVKTKTAKLSSYESYHFDTHLEMNNLRLHEWPMSRELHLPIRSKYTDIALQP